jgi:aminoglycoside phosphotransferase (APT) family kinase protein
VRLHEGELDISVASVRRLLAEQFPAWASRPLTPVAESGTEHLMFRLGDDLVIRMPRMPGAAATILKEHRWLPFLAPRLPLEIPVPVALGRPGLGFPLPWSVSRWRDGDHGLGDLSAVAIAMGGFILALRNVDIADAPPAYRGGPYAGGDHDVRIAARDLDIPDAVELWDQLLKVPAWDGPPVWLHSDLLPPNLLARDGRLTGVIDFGCAGIGDPACDLMPAWTVFDAASRPAFRAAADVDDATWERGRAWALRFGLGAWHYYRELRPAFADLGRRTVNQTLTPDRSST